MHGSQKFLKTWVKYLRSYKISQKVLKFTFFLYKTHLFIEIMHLHVPCTSYERMNVRGVYDFLHYIYFYDYS